MIPEPDAICEIQDVDALMGRAVCSDVGEGTWLAEIPGEYSLELWAVGTDAAEARFVLRQLLKRWLARREQLWLEKQTGAQA